MYTFWSMLNTVKNAHELIGAWLDDIDFTTIKIQKALTYEFFKQLTVLESDEERINFLSNLKNLYYLLLNITHH